MNRKNVTFVAVFILLLSVFTTSCSTYKVAKNGYIVQGDDNFVSIDEKLSLLIGSSLLSDEIWENSSPPLIAAPLSSSQRKVLKKLGYKKRNYTVIFRNAKSSPFQLISIINNVPITSKRMGLSYDFPLISSEPRMFHEKKAIGGKDVYHAIVSVNEKLFKEKYVSFIFIGDFESQYLPLIEKLVERNHHKFWSSGQTYFPMKTVEGCPVEEPRYFDYTVPESVKTLDQYIIIKAVSAENRTDLAYYSLLTPGFSMGSFKICRGSYILQYTTLDGQILYSEEITI